MKSFVLPAFSLILVACSAESAVVGGECRVGYTLTGDRCVSELDPTLIGNGSTQATPTTASDPSSTTKVASAPLGSSSSADGATPPAQPSTGSGSGASSSSGGTTPPFIIPAPPSTPAATPDPVCDAGTVLCHDSCIPVDADAQNCGACGRTCPSNICAAGACQGATPGDIVAIGLDVTQAPAGSTNAKVFANAVTLPTTDPLRILAFEDDASPATIDRTRTLAFGATTRQVRIGVATADMLTDPNLYASWDVVLVDAVAGTHASDLGARSGQALDTFTRAGGVLVALDDGSGDVPSFLRTASLLDLGLHTSLPADTQFTVAAANDTVGAHLLSPFATYGTSWGFAGAASPSTDLAWVIETADGNAFPTVVHRVARSARDAATN